VQYTNRQNPSELTGYLKINGNSGDHCAHGNGDGGDAAKSKQTESKFTLTRVGK
jgi:hypothetical protein